jgi:hypothetical protein
VGRWSFCPVQRPDRRSGDGGTSYGWANNRVMTPAAHRPAQSPTRPRLLRALVAACVAMSCLGLFAPPAAAGNDSACSAKSADVTIPVRSFHIDWKWDKKSYKIGQTAKLSLTVTRPSDKDPVSDDGQPLPVDRPTSAPAEGVTVGVGIYVGDVFLSGGGITDAEGKLVAPVRIQSYTKPGMADQTIYAFKRYLTETRCVYVQEFEFVHTEGVFKVTR